MVWAWARRPVWSPQRHALHAKVCLRELTHREQLDDPEQTERNHLMDSATPVANVPPSSPGLVEQFQTLSDEAQEPRRVAIGRRGHLEGSGLHGWDRHRRGQQCQRDPGPRPDDHVALWVRVEASERRRLARAERLGVVWRQERASTADASVLVQRSVGREPEHCSRPAGR
jgi:hypothetical protein